MSRSQQAILACVVLGAGIGLAQIIASNRQEPKTEEREAPRRLIRATRVRTQNHRYQIRSQGTVRARTTSTIAAEVSGRIANVSEHWAEGAFFAKDATLLSIDRKDYEAAKTALDAEAARARLKLALEKEESDLAVAEWKLRNPDKEPPPLVARVPQLAEAQAAVDAADARLEQATRDLERTKVKVPFPGRVLERLVDVGQFVARGTPIARVYAVDYAEVRLPIPDRELEFLNVSLNPNAGDEPKTTFPPVKLSGRFAGQMREWTGTIDRIEGQIDPQTRMVYVVARVDRPYESNVPLSVGMFVQASIDGRDIENVFVLPRSVLRETNRVYVADEGKLQPRRVDVLRFEGDRVIARGKSGESGDAPLAAGELLCLSKLSIVVPGMLVDVQEEAPEDDSTETRSP
ncbi:MAG: efflux RND transporter periplasmic adaptor subunit [Planctomycetota bacterium]